MFKARLREERRELAERVEKLTAYISKAEFNRTETDILDSDLIELEMLKTQLIHMTCYLRILEVRLKKYDNNSEENSVEEDPQE